MALVGGAFRVESVQEEEWKQEQGLWEINNQTNVALCWRKEIFQPK